MSSLLQYVDMQRSLIALSSSSSIWYLEVKTGQYFSHLLKLNETFISTLNLFTDAPPLVTNFQQFLHNNLASTRPSGDKKVLLETQQSFFLKKFSFSLQASNAKQKTKKKHLTSNRQIRLYSLFFTDKNVQFSTVFPAKIGLCLLLIIPCIDIHDKGPSWTVSLTG